MNTSQEYASSIPKALQYVNEILEGKTTLSSLQSQVPDSWIKEVKKILESRGYLIVEDSPAMKTESNESDLNPEEISNHLESAKNNFIDETNMLANMSGNIGIDLPAELINKVKLETRFAEQIEDLNKEAEREFLDIEPMQDFTAKTVKNMSDIASLPLDRLSQHEFAYWLQNNRSVLESELKKTKNLAGHEIEVNPYQNGYYNLLTVKPELRQLIIAQQGILADAPFDDARTYYKMMMQEEGKYKNADSNPDWLEFSFGATKNTEADGMRRKGYITISPASLETFKGSVPEILKKLNEALEGKYNGSFKIAQKLTTLTNQFDNIVIHGANEQEVDKALEIIHKVLSENSIINSIAQKGKDGIKENGDKTSHTSLLADKIKAGKVEL